MPRESVDPRKYRSVDISTINYCAGDERLVVTMTDGKSVYLTPRELSKLCDPERIAAVLLNWDADVVASLDAGEGVSFAEDAVIRRRLNGFNLKLAEQFISAKDYVQSKRRVESLSSESILATLLRSSGAWRYNGDVRCSTILNAIASLVAAEKAFAECDQARVTELLELVDASVGQIEAQETAFATHETNRKRGIGAAALGARRQDARAECARLLREKRPAEGWKSQAHASEAILVELEKFRERHPATFKNLGGRQDCDLQTTILSWLSTDASIREAYLQGEF